MSSVLELLNDRLWRAKEAARANDRILVELSHGTKVRATVQAGQELIPLALLAHCHIIRIEREGAGFDVVHDTMRTTPYWEVK